jgi:uncharacterized protein
MTKPVVHTQTALITGGSSGIGYAIARELAGRNYDLILVSNQLKQLEEACLSISTDFGVKAMPVYLDLAGTNAAEKLFEKCKSEHLRIDVLVNNAGMFFFGEVPETDPGKVNDIISLHTTTPAVLCTLFGKEMKERRSGNILIISSLAAYMPYPGIALYNATKLFLKGFSRALRTEMLDYNVNVTCICPGAVSTNLYTLDEADIKKALKTGIMMQPEKLARKAVKSMIQRKALVIPGFVNRFFLALILFTPHSVISLIRRNSRFLPPDKYYPTT